MNRRRCSSRRIALSLAAGSLLAIGGCDGGEDVQASLSRAEHRLTSISAGRGASPSPEHARQVYQQVRSDLAPVLEKGLAAEQAAANILIAEAELGEAMSPARELIAAERDGLDRLQEIGGVHALWTDANRQAELAGAWDPAEQRQKLQGRLEQIRRESEALAGQRQQLQSRHDDLSGEAQQFLQDAASQAERSAELQMQADANIDDALEIVERVQEHRRLADASNLEAEQLRIELDVIEPQLERQAMELDRLSRQREAVEAALARLDEGERHSRDRARTAREQAETFGAELRELVLGSEGYVPFRQGPLADALDATAQAFERAEATARRAGGELRANAQLVSARAQQAIGRAYLEHASTGEIALEVLRSIREVPALRGQGLEDALQRLEEDIQASKSAAAEAYQQAVQAYSGAGFRGEAADRLPELEASINRLTERLGVSSPGQEG